MRIPHQKVGAIAGEMTRALVDAQFIDCSSPRDVQADVEAVLEQYVRDEQAVADRARDLLAMRNLPSGELGRLKKLAAEERKIKLGDEAIDYLLDQLVEMLMHSSHVDEVYAADHDLRLKMRGPLRKIAAAEEEMAEEVRSKMKHVKGGEGSALWEVEYQRMSEEVKRRRGI